MKKLCKISALGLMILLYGGIITAQTPLSSTGNSSGSAGSTTLNIVVPKSADLRAGGSPANGNNGANLTISSSNNALSANLTFNNVTPSNSLVTGTGAGSNRFVWGLMTIRVRSNANYQIKAFLDGTGPNVIPAGAGNSGTFKTGDIGFGMNDTSAPSAPNLLAPGGSLTVSAPFNNAPENSSVVNGQPNFASTLNNIGVGSANATTVASGNRISLRGDNTSNNWRSVRMRFAIKPQYYLSSATPLTETFRIYIVTP